MSEGIYATINQRKDGKTLVRLVEVGNTSISHDSIHHMMSLPQQGWDPYKVLDVLLKVIKDCESIYAIAECPVEEAEAHDDWAALFTEDKTQKLLVANMRLSSDVPAFERDFDERVFDSRQEALDAIYNHYSPVLMSKNLLWDLDANTFTWFTEGDYYSIRAYNFATGQYEFCCRVTYSFEQMKAPEIEKVEFFGRSSSKDIIPLFGESSSPSEEGPEKGETYTPAHLPGETINYTAQRHDDGPATTVTGSIYSVSTPRVTRNFQGLTYTAVLDTRFGFDTWVYKLMQNGKQVWRWSHTPKIDGQDGDVFLEGLYTAVATYDPDDMTEKMTKGLYYNDLDHVFESKILRTVETSLYRHLMEKTAPYGQKRISGLTRLLKDTLHRVDSAKNTEERKRLMARLVAYDPQADEFTLIPGGKEEVFREGGPKKGWFYFAYSVIVAAPVFVPEFDEGDLVSSVQVYTKEGYAQETIALLLGMTVKQVADIQKAGR